VVVPGKRTAENCRKVVEAVGRRTAGRTDLLVTSDAYAPHATAIEEAYQERAAVPKRPGPGRPPKPERVMPAGLCYATVRKRRGKGRAAGVPRALVFGLACVPALLLGRPAASRTINTAFAEGNNGTGRRQNGREHRKAYGFSRDTAAHAAATYCIGCSYNFWWAVRTSEVKGAAGRKQPRTAAMAAGLANHVWALREWPTCPAKPC
jgi:hypothetical protein